MVGVGVDSCEIRLWGHTIAAAFWDPGAQLAAFEYHPSFQSSGIEVAPLQLPLSNRIYRFPELRRTSLHGLPGLLADSLPGDFSRAVIEQWLIREGRDWHSFNPIEQLCYVGQRGMGALEFRPAIRNTTRGSIPIDVAALTKLAQNVLDLQVGRKVRLRAGAADYSRSLDDILRVGTSAGGARAQAVVAWNPHSGEFRSGQVESPDGFEYWLLKLDGVSDREPGQHEGRGNGRIEYAYSLMASAAGINMAKCRLLQENGRCHFMMRRFDRSARGEKLHLQSLCALAHMDKQLAGAQCYAQAFDVMQRLVLPQTAFHELFRRMAFNVVTGNQNDHTRTVAFLMNKAGQWSLAPAFDVIPSYGAADGSTHQHQMTSDSLCDVLLRVAHRFQLQNADNLLSKVIAAIDRWPEFANAAGVPDEVSGNIAVRHRKLQH